MPSPDIRLVIASDDDSLAAVRGLFREYAGGLAFDLHAETFDAELAGLPGDYAAPHGHLLLALVDGTLAGCGAFRGLTDVDYANACEMKRLYVRPAFRRFGLGRLLAQALLDEARRAGYSATRSTTWKPRAVCTNRWASKRYRRFTTARWRDRTI